MQGTLQGCNCCGGPDGGECGRCPGYPPLCDVTGRRGLRAVAADGFVDLDLDLDQHLDLDP